MIKKINLKNFTVFKKADFKFTSGLNVIIGENATGKTHLLKIAYLLSTVWPEKTNAINIASKEWAEKNIANRLLNIFKPDSIGSVVNNQSDGKADITCVVDDGTEWQVKFSNRSETNVSIVSMPDTTESSFKTRGAVYLPSKEMLSFYEGFLALYETHELQFDETFRDLALRLSTPRLKNRPEVIDELIGELSEAIGGKVILQGGRFYIMPTNSKRKQEVTLLAEGLRKLATILLLIENGSLKSGGTLFWDEPEANMNPRLIKLVVKALITMCDNGIQVIIATHSLFLLRELAIESGNIGSSNFQQQYFSLKPTLNGVKATQSNTLEDIDPLVALDESLQQSERYMEQG